VIVDNVTGHCRRRKIRCQLPLPEDVQGRCTNCIRLKKECNFYPVDQSPSTDGKPPQQARRDTGLSTAPSGSSQSSPHISGASQPGSVAEDSSHVQLQSPKMEHMRSQQEGGGFSLPSSSGEGPDPLRRAPLPSILTSKTGHAFYAAPGEHSNAGWPEQSPSLQQYPQQHRASVADSQYWSASNTPTTAHYSHDSAMPFSATTPTNYHSPNFPYSQSGSQFSAPARAMSFGHVEGMSHSLNYSTVQYGHHEAHPSYTLPSQGQFMPNAFGQHASPSIPQQNMASESIPRSWNTAPSAQTSMDAPQNYHQHPPQQFYAQQHPQAVYEQRSLPGYSQHPQYYPPASNPG
jgi:hypothetical protein